METTFTYNNKTYTIYPDPNNSSLFGTKDSVGDWHIVAMGDEFNPSNMDMTLDEMLAFIEAGIQGFLNMDKVTIEDLKATDYQDFFISELYDHHCEGEAPIINKEYIIIKLYCGKENAKSCIL